MHHPHYELLFSQSTQLSHIKRLAPLGGRTQLILEAVFKKTTLSCYTLRFELYIEVEIQKALDAIIKILSKV